MSTVQQLERTETARNTIITHVGNSYLSFGVGAPGLMLLAALSSRLPDPALASAEFTAALETEIASGNLVVGADHLITPTVAYAWTLLNASSQSALATVTQLVTVVTNWVTTPFGNSAPGLAAIRAHALKLAEHALDHLPANIEAAIPFALQAGGSCNPEGLRLGVELLTTGVHPKPRATVAMLTHLAHTQAFGPAKDPHQLAIAVHTVLTS